METQIPVTSEEGPPSEWRKAIRQFAKRGLVLCLVLFLIELGLLLLVSSAPYFPGEESFYAGQAKSLGSLVQSSTTPQLALQIFTNNYRIALEEMIPGFGVLLFAISLYATARVTEAIALQDGVPAIYLVLLLFILPHSWIELPAYAVATAEGLYLLLGLWTYAADREGRREGALSMEAAQFGINLLIVTVMLAVAAVFESVEIAIGEYALVTWIPFAVIIGLVVVLNGQLSRIRKEERAAAAPGAQVLEKGE